MIQSTAPSKANAWLSVRDALCDENAGLALQLLRESAAPGDDAIAQALYARFAKTLTSQLPDLPVLRIAFLANATLEHWVEVLRFWLLLEGYRLQELIVPYGTWRQQVADPDSSMYRFRPDVVWLFLLPSDLRHTECTPQNEAAEIGQLLTMLVGRLPASLIVNNVSAPANRIYGNLEASISGSVTAHIEKFNDSLPLVLPTGSVVFDMRHLASRFGLDRWEDSRLWHHSKHPFALDAQGSVAFAGARVLAAFRGRARKCLVLDLDNTLWGGVIGDDGISGIRVGPDGGSVGEAFAAFQSWLKALTQRGIALAVCSKNNERLAREPFEHKDGMVLTLDDFVSFKANWDNKADNLREIAQELNLGLESFVFVDDNPAERALVRRELPYVAVPEMPTDPADYISALTAGAWFESISITNEDLTRVQAYRSNVARQEAQAGATDLDAYLDSLEMEAHWGTVDSSTLARVAQLVNKTNQFNLTTKRYSEAQIQALAASPDTWVGRFSLKDRFGDHGLIAVVILRFADTDAIIDTWVMSCRVFARQMEYFTFDIIRKIVRQRQARYLSGMYVPSPKNAVVADLYNGLGGVLASDSSDPNTKWTFDMQKTSSAGNHYIKEILQEPQTVATDPRGSD
jgi:FkbH-like protein